MESFEHALAEWLRMVNEMLIEHRKTFCSSLAPTQVRVRNVEAPKYLCIIREDDSVFCFVDRRNGDVLKAASWRAPAPHARGNVFTRTESLGVGAFGANYIQRGVK